MHRYFFASIKVEERTESLGQGEEEEETVIRPKSSTGVKKKPRKLPDWMEVKGVKAALDTVAGTASATASPPTLQTKGRER